MTAYKVTFTSSVNGKTIWATRVEADLDGEAIEIATERFTQECPEEAAQPFLVDSTSD